ncbi:MAG: ribosomal-processing cysteine protease Prp [Synergistetes bacterium]|nr:ribosomal-processing cysteine protease Prp [Synergistota bacterium]
MLRITLKRERSGRRVIIARGHTGYAEEGRDIVCAGVSALLQTLLLWLKDEYAERIEAEKEKGLLYMSFPADERSELVLAVFWKGLSEISKAYPNHVRCEEVKEE